MTTFSERLRFERENLNYTQKEFAEKLNIASNTYNGYETGNRMPNLEIVSSLADALNISVDYLLGRTDIKDNHKNKPCLYFANRIKSLRESFSLTQVELAKKFNVTSRTISQYERGIRTPDFNLLNNFADFFNVSVDYLLGRTDSKEFIRLSDDDLLQLNKFIDFLTEKFKK